MLVGLVGKVRLRQLVAYYTMTQHRARASDALQLVSNHIGHLAVEPKYRLHII